MSNFNKSHSPARVFMFQEVIKCKTQKKIKGKSLKNELKELNLDNEKKVEVSRIFFRPKMFKDVFLAQPNEINQLINLTRIRRNTTKDLVRVKKNEKVVRFEGDRKKIVKFQEFNANSSSCFRFFQVIKAGYANELRELLIQDPGLVGLTDSVGMTGLHWAAKRNQKKIADILISYDCQIDIKDIFGRTALDVAKKSQYPEIIHLISTQIMKNELKDSLKASTLHELTALPQLKTLQLNL